jgi:hypothetical protein
MRTPDTTQPIIAMTTITSVEDEEDWDITTTVVVVGDELCGVCSPAVESVPEITAGANVVTALPVCARVVSGVVGATELCDNVGWVAVGRRAVGAKFGTDVGAVVATVGVAMGASVGWKVVGR